jgi:hypothetical protein
MCDVQQEVKGKLPQNIQHMLMEIGEKSVLLKLYLLTRISEWGVFQNVGESGCDIVLIHKINSNKIKVEVKTRQRIYTTSDERKRNTVHFTVTENEYQNCDFVACYWWEENYYFIVPKCELTQTSSNGIPKYKFIVRKRKDGSLDDNSLSYLNKWDYILGN